MGGGQLFKASALLDLPEGTSIDELRSTLEALADDLMVDISFDGVPRKRS
jgi:glycine cleavage system regulatory protein